MGKRIIVLESEKKHILSLYEDVDDKYKKENDFLKEYIGKPISVTCRQVMGGNNCKGWVTLKINNITYGTLKDDIEGVSVRVLYNNSFYYVNFDCDYNKSEISLPKDEIPSIQPVGKNIDGSFVAGIHMIPLTETINLINNINVKGRNKGIRWCQRMSYPINK
jgi:hypothetical protein